MCLLAICVPSLEKFLFKSFVHISKLFLKANFYGWCLNISSYSLWVTSSLTDFFNV